jgi:hypothetical protein
MLQGPESMANGKESPGQVPEFTLLLYLQCVCVVEHCHAEESLHVIDPGVFAGLLAPDGEVIDNSV